MKKKAFFTIPFAKRKVHPFFAQKIVHNFARSHVNKTFLFFYSISQHTEKGARQRLTGILIQYVNST